MLNTNWTNNKQQQTIVPLTSSAPLPRPKTITAIAVFIVKLCNTCATTTTNHKCSKLINSLPKNKAQKAVENIYSFPRNFDVLLAYMLFDGWLLSTIWYWNVCWFFLLHSLCFVRPITPTNNDHPKHRKIIFICDCYVAVVLFSLWVRFFLLLCKSISIVFRFHLPRKLHWRWMIETIIPYLEHHTRE